MHILLVSDIHESWEYVEKLEKINKSYDFVLVSGDQANCNNLIGETTDPKLNQLAEESNKRIIESLSKRLVDGGKVFYIPGNHDAEILFRPDDEPKIGTSMNIHTEVTEISPGLMLAGFGGSLPT